MKGKGYKRKIQLLGIDLALYVAAYYIMAVVYSSDLNIFTSGHYFYFIKGIVLCALIFTCRVLLKVYSSLWRYANYSSYAKLVFADVVGSIIYLILGLLINSLYFSLKFVFVISSISVLCCLVTRFAYQIIYAHRHKVSDARQVSNDKLNKINVAIVGAGNVGVSLVRVLMRNPRAHYNPYCFIDNDPEKAGTIVSGLRVYYDDDKIIEKIKNMPIQEIVIAVADLDPDRKTKLFERFKATNCKVKIYDYPLEGNEFSKGVIREFKIEDLLFRDSLEFSTEESAKFYSNKIVMVTGGGGSIGSEVCRQVAKQNPKKLIILDIYENNAYEIQQELIRKHAGKLDLEVIIASVRDEKRIDEVFAKYLPDVVIHAAAHKHVPLMENNAQEVIKNNVMGTYNVANMAEKYCTERFLLISSDKAVNPTNVMGASKRLCEMVIQCRQDSKTTKFTAVRFGNVLGSNGSVIPLFKRQIENGGPITITDKRMIRYFMTIPEATQLVLEAGSIAKSGELFVLDMGKPVKILNLAENMIRLSGLTPYEDVDIKEVGLRPGEKLYEELLMSSEDLDKTQNKMIFIEKDKPYTRKQVEDKLKILLKAVKVGDNDSVREAIRQTVPTYITPEFANSKLSEMSNPKYDIKDKNAIAE